MLHDGPVYDENNVHYSHAPRVPRVQCYPRVPFRRGDIFFIQIDKYQAPGEKLDKYVLILQDETEFPNSPSVMVATFSSKNLRPDMIVSPVFIPQETGLPKSSRVILDQLYTIDRKLLVDKAPAGRISDEDAIELINQGLVVATGIITLTEARHMARR